MFGFNTCLVQRRYNWTTWGPPGSGQERGSGFCVDQGQYVALIKQFRFHERILFECPLEKVDVPSWAWIQLGTLGRTSWESPFTAPWG